MSRREDLIRELAADLAPAQTLAPPAKAAVAWGGLGAAIVAAVTLAAGPLRPGLVDQLTGEPGFLLDLALGALALATAAWGAMRLRVPGSTSGRKAAVVSVLALAAWAAWQLVEWTQQSSPPSRIGERPGCVFEVVLFAVPPLVVAFWLVRRAAPLERGWTGFVAGLAAGILPALAMQVACMESPLHALGLHITPVLVAGAIGGLLGRWLLPRV